MGLRQAKFDEETMNDFEATTPLNRAEIYYAFKQFHQLYQDYVPTGTEEVPVHPLLTADGHIDPEVSLPIDVVCKRLPALKANPFRDRICRIFAISGTEMMSFLEFLDMVAAFSPNNTVYQKAFHAFQIFDVNGDGVICRSDMSDLLDTITDKKMKQESKDVIITSIFHECNKEELCDGLTTEDFHYAISRSPDFASTFSFRL